MELINKIVWVVFHLSPKALNDLTAYIGVGNLYVVLFVIIFAETGFVVTPFLPGDSLLFAVGAIASYEGSPINLWGLTTLLIVAAVVGDAVNYWIGAKIGPSIFRMDDDSTPADVDLPAVLRKKSLLTRMLNKKHLLRAQEFYEKYGGKTIILARFIPIVRTFAPFVAGIGKMNYFRFALYNVVGAIAWVLICVSAGYYFGRIEFVQNNFELVIIAIIVISVLPMAVELLRAWMMARQTTLSVVTTGTTTVTTTVTTKINTTGTTTPAGTVERR